MNKQLPPKTNSDFRNNRKMRNQNVMDRYIMMMSKKNIIAETVTSTWIPQTWRQSNLEYRQNGDRMKTTSITNTVTKVRSMREQRRGSDDNDEVNNCDSKLVARKINAQSVLRMMMKDGDAEDEVKTQRGG